MESPAKSSASAESEGEPSCAPLASKGARILPHEGHVFVDDVVGGQMVTHTVTHESRMAPADHRWSLVFHEGYGALASETTDEILFLDQWLDFNLYEIPGDGTKIIQRSDGSSSGRRAVLNWQRSYQEANSKWDGAASLSEVELRLFRLSCPREGVVFFVEAQQLYKLLKLTSYSGEGSKWCHDSVASWTRALAHYGIRNQVLKSTQGLSRQEVLVGSDRFLPKCAISVLAMFCLLWRWCKPSPHQGGLREVAARSLAATLATVTLQAVCASIDGLEDFVMNIDFCSSWCARGPRPPQNVNVMSFRVDEHGIVDISEWRDQVLGDMLCGNSCKVMWWGAVKDLDGCDEGHISLFDFMASTNMCLEKYSVFYGQVLRCLGDRAEVILSDSLRSSKYDRPLKTDGPSGNGLDERVVDVELASYVMAAKRATEGLQHLSVASGKAFVRGLNLQNGSMVTPGNLVVAAFTPNQSMDTEEDKLAARAGEEERARNYLKRKDAGEAEEGVYRPQKRHRRSAAKFLKDLDNQVRATTSFPGLSHWSPKHAEEKSLWSSWRTWPHLSLVQDQGSDDRSGVFSLGYFEELRCNVSAYWDPAHGSWRDTLAMIKKSGNFAFVLVALVAANRNHGPDSTDLRFLQTKQAMRHHFEVSTPRSSPLFLELSSTLMEQFKGQFEVSDGQDPLDALWLHMKGTILTDNKGYRANLNRFHSVIADCARLLRKYAQVLFETQYMCLEMDFISTKVWNFMMQCLLRHRDPDAPTTTSSSTLALDDKALRSTGANAVVVCMLLLSNPDSRRLLSAIVQAGLSVQRWHETSNKELRDVHRSKAWLLDQVTQGFAEHLSSIWGGLENPDTLRQCELLGVSDACHRSLPEEVVMYDDEHAEAYGNMVVNLLGLRAKRCLWMFLPPINMVAMLSPDEAVAERSVASLRQLYEDYEKALAVEGPSATLKSYLKRHPCQLLAVEQLKQGFDEEGWRHDNGPVADLLHCRFACLMTSQSVEDINNVEKNYKKSTGWGGRYRKPETSMYAAVTSQVLSKSHRFEAPRSNVYDQPVEPLPVDSFVAKGKPSIPVDKIVTPSQPAPYVSPQAESTGVAWADAAVLRACSASDDFDLPSKCWQGFWADSDHGVVFKVSVGGVTVHNWHLALHHYSDSAVIAMPVEMHEPPGYQGGSWQNTYIKPVKNAMVVPIAVTNLAHITAFTLKWRSWSWQVQKYPDALGRWGPAVRAFQSAQAAPILKVAGRSGWWNLSKTVLDKVAAHQGLNLGRGQDLFNNLWALTASVLPGTSDEDLLKFLQHRLKSLQRKAQFTNELLAIDEALVCLDQDDQQEVRRQQADAKDKQKEAHTFKESYRKRSGEVRVARAKTQAAKKSAGKVQWKGPTSLPSFANMTQREAKMRMPPSPPKSWLWRANNQGAWCSRVGELPTCSRSDRAHGGEELSLRLVLQDAWRNWLTLQGYGLEECPIVGLFDVVDPRATKAPARAGGGASSSSSGL